MPDPTPERIVGRFYTVEDLMNLPEDTPVDPRKAREVSRDVPVKLWMSPDELISLLLLNIEVIQANSEGGSAEEARQAELLIAQRRLWIARLEQGDGEDVHIGLYPASPAGDEYDDEAAVRAD